MIQVGDNYTSDWNSYVSTAIGEWSKAANIDYVSVSGHSAASSCNAVYGTVQLCSGNYGANGNLGYTYVWTSGSYIVQATIKLNTYYFDQPKYNTAAWKAETVCQELGNALGLADSDHNTNNLNNGSCTDYTRDPTGKTKGIGPLANTAVSATDLAHLNAIYAAPGGSQLASTQYGGAGSANAAVPEPATWTMLLTGFGAVGARLRRRTAAAC